jgi:hypothetical protein
VVRIKTLLYDEGFTIPGARQQLRADAKDGKAQPTLFGHGGGGVGKSELRQVRSGLKEILGLLSARR